MIQKQLSELEHAVMQRVWAEAPATAEQLRRALRPARVLKDSSVRTVLRRLEEKGYVKHRVVGRAYVYESVTGRSEVAARTVREILERFCDGSLEALFVGLVENGVVEPAELEKLAREIARQSRTDAHPGERGR